MKYLIKIIPRDFPADILYAREDVEPVRDVPVFSPVIRHERATQYDEIAPGLEQFLRHHITILGEMDFEWVLYSDVVEENKKN